MEAALQQKESAEAQNQIFYLGIREELNFLRILKYFGNILKMFENFRNGKNKLPKTSKKYWCSTYFWAREARHENVVHGFSAKKTLPGLPFGLPARSVLWPRWTCRARALIYIFRLRGITGYTAPSLIWWQHISMSVTVQRSGFQNAEDLVQGEFWNPLARWTNACFIRPRAISSSPSFSGNTDVI